MWQLQLGCRGMKKAIRTLTLLAGLLVFQTTLGAADASKAAPSPQIILLKLDDVVALRVGAKPVSARWLRVYDYLKANGIKGSFGIITESLEKDNPMYFQWIKDVQDEGLIEFWMHGYRIRGPADQGEFEHGTFEEQKAILEKGTRLAKEKLGFALPAFGPHWSGTTEATDQALEAVPDIKIWLYGPPKPKFFSRLSLERVLALENPTFVPDPVKFKSLYEKHAAAREVLVLQGHPNQWDDKRWAGFVEIIEFLQSKNVVFLTPSEYLARVSAVQK
jgi:peptidoglycan/xylan/chitin deacetylase (PgdA/CDA1 family)